MILGGIRTPNKTFLGGRVGPNDIDCKIGDFGLSLKMNKMNENQPYFESEPTMERLPLYLWAPECQRTPRFFTEYSDVFTFGMLIWEVFQIDECRKSKNCQIQKNQNAKPKPVCNKCEAHRPLSRDFLVPRHEKLPLPKLLKSDNNIAKEIKTRVYKCWRYNPADGIHQKT